MAAQKFQYEEPNMISDWLEQNRNPEIDKQVEKEVEYLSRQEIKLEDIFNDEKRQGVKELIDKHKQETLEEAAERYWAKQPYNEDAFMEGAKWQQERSYSEEEVLEIIRQYAFEEHLITSSKPDIWFEQFKKK